MAIAQLTPLRISISSSGAPPGQMPAECFPGGHPGGRGAASVLTGVTTTDLAGGGGGGRRRTGTRSAITDLASGGKDQQRHADGGAGRTGALCHGFRFAAPAGVLSMCVAGRRWGDGC